MIIRRSKEDEIINNKKRIASAALLVLLVGSVCMMSGCISSDSDEKGTVKFGLPPWPGVTVKSEVVKIVLEDMGYEVELNSLDAGVVYAQMAEGELDVCLAGWLPVTHEAYWEEYGDSLEMVNINVDTTWLGIAVPTYVYDAGVTTIYDLEDYASEFDNRIVGIEPGAGISKSVETAKEAYGLDSIELLFSSTPSMMAEVDSAIDDDEWVAFTIWEPHSAFAMFDIAKLEDDQGIFGGGDVVYTIARNDFADDFPEVYEFLQKFAVDPDVQSAWILQYSDLNRPAAEVAQEWVDNNQDLISEWTS